MRYINDKNKNKLSILGYGCMRFPRKGAVTDLIKTEELIKTAIDNGVNYFDTAYIYPGSEKALGEVLHKNNLRDKVNIATKLPLVLVRKKEDFDKYFNEQLKRLQTNNIDYYLMHMLINTKTWDILCEMGIKEWIKDKKEKGLIKQIGFSFHGIQSEFLKLLDVYDWDFCQIQYNYMDEHTQAGRIGLEKAYKKGITIIIMEPLLGGVLANKMPKKALEIFKSYNKDRTTVDYALSWLWNQKEVGVVLSGMSKISDLKENINIANTININMINDEEKKVYDDVIKKIKESYKIPCTGCSYCMPCPYGVNIPICFQAYNNYYSLGKFAGFKYYLTNTGVTSKKGFSYASLCKKCGKCERHCPQKIAISEELSKVSKKMEPKWYRFMRNLIRGFLKLEK